MRTTTSSKSTPIVGTGRRTPSGAGTFGRPPSPKVDLTNSKKLNDSKPSPSPKQLGRSLTSNRKSPSNISESNFVSHDRAARKVHSTYNDSHYRHEDADTEQSSVRSVLNEGQLAKIKLVVDHQKSKLPVYNDNDYEPEQVSRQFHSVSNVRSVKVDHDVDFAYRDSFADENYYGDNRHGETNFSQSFDDGRDDCAVSDITTEAAYMSVNESRKIPGGVNNSQLLSSGASVFEPSSLPDLPDSEIDHMMKVLAEEKNRRALQQQQQQQLNAQNLHVQQSAAASVTSNIIPADASSIRKNVKRAKSGGNEAMLTKKSSSSTSGAGSAGIKGTLPSFHTYRQRLDAGDASVVSHSEEGSCHSSQQQPHQFEATIDWEVERALQGLQQPPVRSASPAGLLGHSGAFSQAAGNGASPAGVTGAPHSRGTTLSRGSGAYMPADKMWSEMSPSHYSSPLVYVESPNTTSGMMLNMTNNGRLTADPLRDCNSRGPRLGRPDSSEVEDHHSFPRQSSGNNSVHKTRALESFREAKQYSAQHSENSKQQVQVERFMPLDANQAPSAHGRSHQGGSTHSSQSQSQSQSQSSQSPRAKDNLQIVRPVIRSSSISSDISSVDGLSFSHGQGHSHGNTPHAGAFTAAANSETRAKDMKATYDALLNREFLVSPLSAFDDASHGSWSVNSGRSRRSSTSTTQKQHAKQPHYMAPKGPTIKPTSSHGSSSGGGHSAKHHSVTPVKKSSH